MMVQTPVGRPSLRGDDPPWGGRLAWPEASDFCVEWQIEAQTSPTTGPVPVPTRTDDTLAATTR